MHSMDLFAFLVGGEGGVEGVGVSAVAARMEKAEREGESVRVGEWSGEKERGFPACKIFTWSEV